MTHSPTEPPTPTSEHAPGGPAHDAVALFLESAPSRSPAAAMAAGSGFRSLVASFDTCDVAGAGVRLGRVSEVDLHGRRHPVPGTLLVRPSLVAVLSPLAVVRARGRELAAAARAMWSHCEGVPFIVGSGHGPLVAQTDGLMVGVVESRRRPPYFMVSIPDLPGADPACAQVAREGLQRAFTEGSGAVDTAHPMASCPTIAPFGVVLGTEPLRWLPDLLCDEPGGDMDRSVVESALAFWLEYTYRRIRPVAPMRVPGGCARPVAAQAATAVSAALFPTFFGTPQHIHTERVPDASFAYLDPQLVARAVPGDDGHDQLHRMLCRRRSVNSPEASPDESGRRLVEPGVGRTCLVGGLSMTSRPEFEDFTVLGVGLTPFSEGGFIEMGRPIDGKASMARGWHRKTCAERLEREGCRTGLVVALIELPGETIEMAGSVMAPAGMVVRAFRCALRVKQLDPIVCALHSTQHAPLVAAYLTRRVRDLRLHLNLPESGGLVDDELLGREIDAQGASQASLRSLLAAPAPTGPAWDWATLVRRVRLDVIAESAPPLLDLAKARLAKELHLPPGSVDDRCYLDWFARCLGRQLAVWRRVRFLHDYHHPGISRWQPGTLFSLGENNVTLLAEFPDLDTGVFVDDADDYLTSTLQLSERDVSFLRERFSPLHHRDVRAAETVVRTLTALVGRGERALGDAAAASFQRSYAEGTGEQ